MRCLCFCLRMNERCMTAWDEAQFFWKCCLLFALIDVKTCNIEITWNNHKPIAWIWALNQPSKQSTNVSSNLVHKVDSVTERMNQQPHQANNATMCAAPSFASSPCLPSDWCTFCVSLLKCASRHVVFCTLWLRHVSRAATACTSSTSELRKVVQAWCIHFARQNVLRTTTPRTFSTCQHPNVLRACGVFIMLTWTYASCHNDVQCFISDIDTCGATNHWDK